MSIQGHIENGVVVVDEPVALPNGTAVRIEPVAALTEVPESRGPVVADTDQAATVEQMAQAWEAITKPIRQENVPLAVDPDDYPLF